MASSLLPRLFLKRAPPFPIPSFHLLTSFNELSLSPSASSHSLPRKNESEIEAKTSPIFPTFPLFSHLDPVWDPIPFPIREHGGGADPVVRADSVKKKRKRKMNKHKLRKLRKQLRLRT